MPESASPGGGGVLHARGVSGLGGGFSMLGGFSMPGGGGLSMPGGVLLARPPPVNRMTDRCKNITLAKTSFRPVIINAKEPYNFINLATM